MPPSASSSSSDYLVIGAGAAGSVLAARLSEDPAVTVTLVEAGPAAAGFNSKVPAGFSKLFRSRWDWAFETEPEPALARRRLYWPRGRAVGGSTVMNAQIWTRGHPGDYDAWTRSGADGWSWGNVLPAFQRIERVERCRSESRGTGGPVPVSELCDPNPMTAAFLAACAEQGISRCPDLNAPPYEGADTSEVIQRRGRRVSIADAYLAPARDRPNLRILTDTVAARLTFEGARASGVTAVRKGRELTLSASREVVLSAGAVNTPVLLLRSGIGPPDHLESLGIRCRIGLPGVGANLQDHPVVVTVFLSPPGDRTSLAGAESIGQLARWALAGRGMLTSNVAEALAFLRSTAVAELPDVELLFAPVPFVDHGFVKPGHGLSIGAVVLRPESRGTVRLRSGDPLAPPALRPGYYSDPEGHDLAAMARGVRTAGAVMASPALSRYVFQPYEAAGDLRSDAELFEFIRAQTETLYHPVGTARMGAPGDPATVVDSQLRVLGVSGLRVADASVMPALVGAHPMAATVMIGERGAALLRGEA